MADHRRVLRVVCMWASVTVFGVHGVAAEHVSPRIRPVGTRMASLLARGRIASPTLARLIDVLEQSDVIVHIEERWRWLDRRTIGETQFVAYAGGQRYLRISIDARCMMNPRLP